MTDERAQELIDKAMESCSLKQRNVVGVITGRGILLQLQFLSFLYTFITGLMGSGKTTLLHHLFGEAPPDLYTSTGVAEQSLRGLLHHVVHLSAGAWERITYKNIREFLAPLIRIGVNEARIDSLACRLVKQTLPSFPPAESHTGKELVPLDRKSNDFTDTSYVITRVSESHTSKKLVPLVQEATDAVTTGTSEDLVLELVHMIDTGGQPELMEVIPSFIHNANLALVLVNLMYGLNECPEANYHEKGKRYERQISSYYTGRDIILKLASTLQAKQSVRESFNLFIVATHRDCIKGELKDEVETLNKELDSLLLPTFKNKLIMFEESSECDEIDKIAFVLNLKAPNDDDKEALELIRKGVSNTDLGKTFDTPASFFAFEQDLLQYAKDVAKRSILSLHECKQVGANVKMSGETVEAALVFFHRQNTFLYFKHVLPNHIFTEPQIPYDIVNGIVRFSYKKKRGIPATVSLLKDGIITEELLSNNQISPHFVKGFYEVKDAIKLFCHTFTLAPLQPDNPENTVDRKKKEYLMMCLRRAKSDKEIEDYVSKITDVTVPLVIKFSSGCVPLGCFGSTISCLLYKYKWEVLKEKNAPKCLAHNIAHLLAPGIPVNVVLVDFTQYIELHVEPDLDIHDSLAEVCSQVHSIVLGAIENVFDIMHLDTDLIKISYAVLCSICTEASEKHLAEFANCNGKYLLRCGSKYGKPSEKQLLWMDIDAASEDPLKKPTLPLLQRFPTKSGDVIQIIERIGTSNHDLGIRLLNDDYGTITHNIEAHYKHDPPSRTTEAILQKWLQGTGRTPQTWDNLITVLREIELNNLAQEIEENLLNIQVQTQRKQTSHQCQKPSPELKTDPKPKPATITRTQGRTDPRPKPGTTSRTQGRTDPIPKPGITTRTQGRTQPKPKPEAITRTQGRTQPKPKPEAITRTQGRTDPIPKPGITTRTQGRTDPIPKPGITTRTQGRTQPKPKPEAITRTQGRTDPIPKPGITTRTQGRTDPIPKPGNTTRTQGRTDPIPKPGITTRTQGRTDPIPKPGITTRTQGRTDPIPKPGITTRTQGRTDPIPKPGITTRTQGRTDPIPKPGITTRTQGRTDPIPKPGITTRTQGRTDPIPKPGITTRTQGRTDPIPKPGITTNYRLKGTIGSIQK